ncbi:hypothetical protein Dimus_000400 [Dionaea muscipula]
MSVYLLQLCDGSIVAFAVLHNVNCNHGFIYVTSQGFLKICQLPSRLIYDNHWPVQKVLKTVSQILFPPADQEGGHQIDKNNLSPDELQRTYTVDEFEVRILEPEKSSGPWQTRATISIHSSESAHTANGVSVCT